MRILAVDVGTGTQDILLFDSSGPIENCAKMVVPSPTAIAAGRIRAATQAGRAVVLTGGNAGGGPCHWALNDHIAAGYPAYATPSAATTFDDDVARLEADGIRLVSDDEAARIDGEPVVLRDLDLEAIRAALARFDVDPHVDGVAVAVLDHGAAPVGMSDRLFRFQHLERVLRATPDVTAFAYLPDDLPDYLTRARCVLDTIERDLPTVFMDTGAAAALGALHDRRVGGATDRFVLNVGNMHAIGFALRGSEVQAVFEHHTGEISAARLAEMVGELCVGSLTQEAVFDSSGHGVLYVDPPPFEAEVMAVTGPRRAAVLEHLPGALEAAPHGDMMISGCFGLLEGFAARFPEAREAVDALRAPVG